MRINAFLRSCGLGSRRHVESLVLDGRVSINGLSIKDLSTQIQSNDIVKVDGRRVRPIVSDHQYVLFHKPIKTLVTRSDPHNRRTIFEYFPDQPLFRQLQPVGRLDYLSEGLLLLTNDGELAHRMTHPRFGHLKIYRVLISPLLDPDHIRKLKQGLQLDDGSVKFQNVKILSRSKNEKNHEQQWIELSLHIGRKRVVRRSLECLGFGVHRLCRVQFGSLRLGQLGPGEYRFLNSEEVRLLRSEVFSHE